MQKIQIWNNENINMDDLPDDTEVLLVSSLYIKDSEEHLQQSIAPTTLGKIRQYSEKNQQLVDDALKSIIDEE